MRLSPSRKLPAHRARRGTALLMAFLVIILLFGIVFQLWFTTQTDLRVADNDVTTTTMDLAIESALQEVYERLATDAEAAASDAGGGAAPGGADPTSGATAAAGGGGGEEQQASDSHEDDWGKPQRTTINEIELRVLVQDEDSKLNLLGMLTADEEQADQAFERVVRVIDQFREGSTSDLDRGDATRMAEEMRRHLRERAQSTLPRPELLSDDEEQAEVGLPLSLREFSVLESFDDGLFRDGRDERGYIVHSLGSFLTVWTSLETAPTDGSVTDANSEQSGTGSAGANPSTTTQGNNTTTSTTGTGEVPTGGETGQGTSGNTTGGSGAAGAAGSANFGVAVNVNTAPATVLKALFDDRDISPRFWDSVIEYRNLEDEDKAAEEDEEQEPVLDEYGNEVIQRQVFDSLDELADVDGYDGLDAEGRLLLPQFLCTQSQVFSIYVTAYRRSEQDELRDLYDDQRAADEEIGGKKWRTVRSVIWRYQDGEVVRIVPLVRWEVLDYIPIEVLDYPDEDR